MPKVGRYQPQKIQSSHLKVKRSEQKVFTTTLLHCQQNFALWKFRSFEFLPWRNFVSRIFAIAKFRSCEFSLRRNLAKRNFASVDAKFRLTQRKFASALTKFRGKISSNFRENKGRKTRISFAFLLHCTVFAFGV